ncbi:recombinase family protein [Streptomyces sp. NPDC048551]|uniref:recombinase family protein n=1 Tax=Streptomyces sp. NPDC048551 TaxID=3155758 RepID=UPI00341E9373
MHQDTICDLYLRLSLDRDGKTAIERQEADCRAWAERNGLIVRKVHIDRGRSGYKTVERKGFDAALAAVTAGVVGTLIVWKLDRLPQGHRSSGQGAGRHREGRRPPRLSPGRSRYFERLGAHGRRDAG